MTRRVEAFCGVGAGILSVLAVLLAVYLLSTSPMVVQRGIATRTLTYLGLVALAGLAVAGGAYLHARWANGAALALLWVAAALLLALTIAAMFSVGLLFLPGMLLGAVAAVAGARSQAARIVAVRENRPSG